jgi:O-glycosyl hydrolase
MGAILSRTSTGAAPVPRHYPAQIARRALDLVVAATIAAVLTTGVAAAETTAGLGRAAAVAHITVTARTLQPIDGWGAAAVSDDPMEPLLEPRLPPAQVEELDRLVFEDAGINLIRVFSPGYGDERSRGLVGTPVAHDPRFAFMRRAARYGVKFMLTGADAPAWMLTVPAQVALLYAQKAGRTVPGKALAPGHEKPYARYLARILAFAQKKNGVPFDYVAIANEPDNKNALLTLTPQQAAETYGELARLIRTEHLRAKLVLGEDTVWASTARYAQAELAGAGVKQETAVIASHSYGGNGTDRRALAALARKNGLRVWQTEWTNGCTGCSDAPEAVMTRALAWSEQIQEALDEADASAWFTLLAAAVKHGARGALIVRRLHDASSPFFLTKRFYVLRQYSSAGPAGSRLLAVHVSPQSPNVFAVAFRKGHDVSVVVTNGFSTTQHVLLDLGAGRARLDVRRTSVDENFRSLQPLRYGGAPLAVTLAKESVTTFTRR